MNEAKMVGYYHDLDDIKLYADKCADEIVADFLNGKGAIVYEHDFVALYFGAWNIEVTTDGKYAVVKDINYCDNLTDFEEGNCFIDIYELL